MHRWQRQCQRLQIQLNLVCKSCLTRSGNRKKPTELDRTNQKAEWKSSDIPTEVKQGQKVSQRTEWGSCDNPTDARKFRQGLSHTVNQEAGGRSQRNKAARKQGGKQDDKYLSGKCQDRRAKAMQAKTPRQNRTENRMRTTNAEASTRSAIALVMSIAKNQRCKN